MRIAEAWWDGDALVVISPRFERLAVPIARIPALRGKRKADLEQFEVDSDGSFVYWPILDVHLGWDQLLQAVDPERALKAGQKDRDFNRRYGAAIRRMRENSGLRQSDISGLSSKQVGRIESGECRATHRAITSLAKAHGLSVVDYLNRVAVS